MKPSPSYVTSKGQEIKAEAQRQEVTTAYGRVRAVHSPAAWSAWHVSGRVRKEGNNGCFWGGEHGGWRPGAQRLCSLQTFCTIFPPVNILRF